MPVTTQACKGLLPYSDNMKLISDASVLHLTQEVIINFANMSDLYKKSIENFPSVYKDSSPSIEADVTKTVIAEASVARARISSILVSRLIAAVNDTKGYGSIVRIMNPQNMGHASLMETFKIEHEDYLSVKDNDDSKFPKINDRDNDFKIILQSLIFKDYH